MNNVIFKKYNAKDIIIFFLAVIILLLILNTGHSYDKSYFKGRVVVAFGDSLTSGVGADDTSDNYVAYLAQSLGITVINKGKGGDTTTKALARIQSDILNLEPQPTVAIVLLGGNDIFRGITKETTEQNLKRIVDLIKKDGMKVVLVGLSRVYFPDYEVMIRNIAFQQGVNYVSAVLDGIINAEELMNDLKHPNADGYKLIAERIEPTLERVLLEE